MALKNNPGFMASSAVHGAALVFLLLNFSSAPKYEDAEETVPVEMITTSDLNQIMNGEKTAKQMPVPQRRADKVASVTDARPLPPLAEAKKDVPLPPSPAKPQDDPGEEDKPVPTPPERVAALPPPTPEPTPPQRPAPEPPKAVEDKPPPPDAEAIEPKPIPRPKIEPKKEAKTEPKPDPKPVPKPPVKDVKAPEPPKKPEPHLKLDEVAKLLKDAKPVSKPKAGNEAKEPPHRDFDPHSISALLDREAPQRKASTGQKLTQVASLGAPNAHAATLSPSMMAQLDQILIDQYHGCWSYFGLGAAQKYIPEVRIHLAQDGSLVGQPALLNPPSDPNLRSLADSAMRAVAKCNPMKIPDRFAPYYDSWAKRVVRFNPEDML